MKRTLILFCAFLVSELSAGCATTIFPPLQPRENSVKTYNNSMSELRKPVMDSLKVKYSNIERIEQILFDKIYSKQSLSRRLSRIEKKMFSRTYNEATDSQRIDNIISNFNQINKYPDISMNILSKMESHVLKQKYEQDNPLRRVERLEEEVFGAVQSGDLNSRYKALDMVYRRYKKNNNNQFAFEEDDFGFTNAYSGSGPTKRNWLNLGGLMNSNSGYMTGFTPPIKTYNNNSRYNRYNRHNSHRYHSHRNNHNNYNRRYPYGSRYNQPQYGYYSGLSNFMTGMGVTILD